MKLKLDFGADSSANDDKICEGFSKKQRFQAFVGCLVFGMLISFMAFFTWYQPKRFAMLFTLGNIVSLVATGFLIGFKRQVRYAFAKKRVVATSIFLTSMLLTIIAAVVIKSILLAIPMVIIQLVAFVYYVASYIPFGQEMVRSALMGCVQKLGRK